MIVDVFFQPAMSKPDTYYVFNHLEIEVTYRSGKDQLWAGNLGADTGRILSEYLTLGG